MGGGGDLGVKNQHCQDSTHNNAHSHNSCYDKHSATPQKLVSLPFDDESFDVVCMLAVLEHLHYPLLMLKEIRRVLVKNGILLLTVPSHAAKPVLEFLSYKLHIIDEAEIRDHKRYFNKADLLDLSQRADLSLESHSYFQFGFNNFAKIRKI